MDNLPEPQRYPQDKRFKDLANHRFGRLTALYFVGQDKWRGTLWLCLCDCGNYKTIVSYSLRKKLSLSCGCWMRERASDSASTHRKTGSPEYQVWTQAKGRCYNPNNPRYYTYGARGITMCEHWRHSFEAFLGDMGARPSACHSIERIDNNKGYCPENCRWATNTEQAMNRTNNRQLTYKGTTQSAKAWAKQLDLPYKTFMNRLYNGWTVSETIEIPLGGRRASRMSTQV